MALVFVANSIGEGRSVGGWLHFKFVVVANKGDTAATTTKTTKSTSFLKKGTLSIKENEWTESRVKLIEKNFTLESDINVNGRGMELSELEWFDGKLLACDAATGYVYELKSGQTNVTPWVRLTATDGATNDPFPCKWMTQRDGVLLVGASGKEILKGDGTTKSYDNFWVKKIRKNGLVESENWYEKYSLMAYRIGYDFPGWLMHETVVADDKYLLFLPRKGSKNLFDPSTEQRSCLNSMVLIDGEDFDIPHSSSFYKYNNTRGFASAKIVPLSRTATRVENYLLTLQVVEVGGVSESFLQAYYASGKPLMDAVKLGDLEFGGVSFVSRDFWNGIV